VWHCAGSTSKSVLAIWALISPGPSSTACWACTRLQPLAAVDVAGYETRLKRLPQLTPGDFASVEQHAKLLAEPLTPETLMAGQEHAIKTRHEGRATGFIS